jgi:D-glycero-alpha-D-manno-heptose 1-phosphate guanylyltransferase
MEAIVLAGGFGTRLRSVVADVPKPMAPIAGRPFLEILLRSLSRKGFKSVVFSIGYMGEKIKDHFGDSFAGMRLNYVTEKAPLGTGGAIRLAMEACATDGPIFVFNGDTFLDIEAQEAADFWRRDRTPVIIAHHVEDASRFGRLGVQDGRIVAFIEKGEAVPGWINAGVYLFDRGILDCFQSGERFSIEHDFLAPFALELRPRVFETDGLFIDIGVPEEYQRAQAIFLNRFSEGDA